MKTGKYENMGAHPKRKLVMGLICLFLVLVMAVGGTVAYYAMTSGGVSNTFSAGSIGCELEETVTNNKKTSITVTNSGSAPVYVRVRLVTYWEDANGNVIGKAPENLSVSLSKEWISIDDTYTYYYKYPLSGATTNLLNAPLNMITDADGNIQVIEVLAESIQASPAEAVKEAWCRTVDADGTITG